MSLLAEFHFLRPLWLLALLPLGVLLVWLVRQGRMRGGWRELVDAELLSALRLEAGAVRVSAPWPWLGLAWLLAVLALAGPSWLRETSRGFRAPDAWVLVLDLSPSMAAADLSPNRVTRARYAMDDLLGAARDTRVGLIVFSDEPYVVSPLTDDVTTVRSLLTPLAPELMPEAGDSLAPALQQAQKLLQAAHAGHPRVILLSDGCDDPAAALRAAAALRGAGIELDVLGVGTHGGAPLPGDQGGLAHDASGAVRLAGFDSALLRQLASAGGGQYTNVTDSPALVARLQSAHKSALHGEGGSAGDEGGAGEDVQVDSWRDEGVWLLPLLVLVAAGLSRRGWL